MEKVECGGSLAGRMNYEVNLVGGRRWPEDHGTGTFPSEKSKC
jgi:hypothetical protein